MLIDFMDYYRYNFKKIKMINKFEETTHYQEILLRGIHISMTADVEWILTMILSGIFTGKEQELDDIYNKPVSRLKIHEKIGAVQIGLIRYHTHFFMEHKEDFKQLHNLRRIRNLFGHGKIDWVSEENKEDLFITEIKDTGLDKRSYKKSELINNVMEYRESVISFLRTIQALYSITP